MSEPSTFEFAKIAVGDGASSEVFTVICGIETAGFNQSASTSDRGVRDCAVPFRPAERRLRVTGRSRTLTGSGIYNTAQTTLINGLVGTRKNYQFIVWEDDDTEAGVEVGTWEGPGIATAVNMGSPNDGFGTLEITVESDGAWTYTAAS